MRRIEYTISLHSNTGLYLNFAEITKAERKVTNEKNRSMSVWFFRFSGQ
jgi:hypothetical protein